jgi:hypothetical protein
MRRLFWVALGATLGVLIVHKVTKTAQAYSPSGMAQGLSGGLSDLGEGLREMAQVVREGMVERETELRQALGIDTATLPDGPETSPQMTPEQVRALLEAPFLRRGR